MLRSLLLCSATPLLLTLAAAPIGLFPLAWIAFVPLLLQIGRAPSRRSALLIGWTAGALYFAANIWWLWTASIPGTIVLILYFGFYWGLGALLLQATGWFRDGWANVDGSPLEHEANSVARLLVGRSLLLAAGWVACEWLRCHVVSGFPWLPLGSTQTPLPLLCQVADLGGPWLISFWVMLINAAVALAWNERGHADARSLRRAAAATIVAALGIVAAYGAYRLQTTVTTPGPRVMVLQSNFGHLRGGAPTAPPEQVIAYFLEQLESQLASQADEQRVDLVMLPESVLPPINGEARTQLAPAPVGPQLQQLHRQLQALAHRHQVALLVGGTAVTDWTTEGSARIGREIRNSVYFYDATTKDDPARYDKTFLVPFSEQAPLAWAPPWLRHAGLLIAAARAVQPMTPGALADLRAFPLSWTPPGESRGATTRILTPICLEAISPDSVRQLLRAADRADGRVGLLATISNDGWFAAQEKHQHFQLVILRCIENRLPLARCSNTGVSGFIDSAGRVVESSPINQTYTASARLDLDPRITVYSRIGDAFAFACIALTATVASAGVVMRLCRRPSTAVARGRD